MIVRSRLLLPVAAVALAVAFAVPAAFADDMSKDSMSKDSGMKKDSMSKDQMSREQGQYVQGQYVQGENVEIITCRNMRRVALRGPVHRASPRCRHYPMPDCAVICLSCGLNSQAQRQSALQPARLTTQSSHNSRAMLHLRRSSTTSNSGRAAASLKFASSRFNTSITATWERH